MPARKEYDELRRRNIDEAAEAALELRDTLIGIPAPERARMLADNPDLLARIPAPSMRAEVLLAGMSLSAEAEQAIRASLDAAEGSASLPAVVTAALVPAVVCLPESQAPLAPRPMAGVVTPRHRISNSALRAWAELGRPSQAAALALAVCITVNGWYVRQAAYAHDTLPPSAKFASAATWPRCTAGLRRGTDFCLYTVSKSLDWQNAVSYLEATDAEEAALKAANPTLAASGHSWGSGTILLVWRGKHP